ncbi:MAG: 16S rRNA (guanine(966)-N(2))-methyltransferase RsmD [bacterium]
MRIIAGSAKGIALLHPTWTGTRPMMDKVKESLFSTVQAYLDNATVLDLYAGSGALGIEALSRGAKESTFIDKSRKCTDLVEKNLKKTDLNDYASVHCTTDEYFLAQHPNNKYDIIFFCPPYDHFITELLEKCSTMLNDEGILIAEHPNKRYKLPDELGKTVRWKQRKFGQTILSFYTL